MGRRPCGWGRAPVVSKKLPAGFLSDRTKGRSEDRPPGSLLDDLGHDPRADGSPTLADREPKALVHGDRLDQLDGHLDIVAGHHHLGPLGEVGDAGDVGGPEVELRAVAREERRVAAALLLGEAVHLGLELRVRGDRARLAEHLTALDVLALRPAPEAADVVAGLALA